MIGIICSNEKEHKYSYELNALLNKLNKNSIRLGVFSIDNIDLKDRTFTGSYISGVEVKPVTLKLPSIIFNLSIQVKNSNIKKIRQIAELEEVTLVNEANKYNQETIIEIMSSKEDTKKYVLPYARTNKKSVYFLNLHPSKLLTCNSLIPVYRIYLQRSTDGYWRFLTFSVNFKEGVNSMDIFISIQDASFNIINVISKFIPSIGCCFIDFVLDDDMNPYFLHFGGFNKKLLSKKAENTAKEKFLINLLDFGNFLKSKAGGDYSCG